MEQLWLEVFATIADTGEDQLSTHIGCRPHMDVKYDNVVHN